MLGMRMMVDVRNEHREWLEQEALAAHRTLREQASFLLEQKIRELRRDNGEPDVAAA